MSPTQSTESDQYPYSTIFILKFSDDDDDNFTVHVTVDISSVSGMNWVGVLTAEKLTGRRDFTLHRIASKVAGMRLMTRVSAVYCGPYRIDSETPITPYELEQKLWAMEPSHLINFLNGALI